MNNQNRPNDARTVSQVVDPDFRPPASFPNTTSLSHSIHDHAMNSAANYSGTFGAPVSGAPNAGSGFGSFQPPVVMLPSFSMPSQPTSFADLANQPTTDTFAKTITESTLNEYGPPNAGNIDYLNQQPSKQPEVGLTGASTFSSAIATSSTSVTQSTSRCDKVESGPSSSKDLPVYSKIATSMEPTSTYVRDVPLFSPPPPPTSPPLDKIEEAAPSTSTADRSTSNARVPKISSFVDSFNNMGLTELQTRYRQYESDLKNNNRRQFEIERVLNNMTRNAHGKNIELDPFFRQKKDEQSECTKLSKELKEKMNRVSEKLMSKFDFKIQPDCATPIQRRAKMSTTAPTRPSTPKEEPPRSKKDERQGKMMLHLNDQKTWCKPCDEHFSSINDFFTHLHSRDHGLKCPKPKTAPWAAQKNVLNIRSTYDVLKSMCGRIASELHKQFDQTHLDRAVSTGSQNKDDAIKSKNTERERGNIKENDPLFDIKGYEFLIPVNGFYCKLCEKTMCDSIEAEQHLKSYDHNMKHAKSVALHPQHEQTFRSQMDRSRVEQHPPEPKKTKAKLSATSGPPNYKKATSHIVDEHDVTKDKFDKKSLPAPAKQPRVHRLNSSDEEAPPEPVVKPTKRSLPDIVPINESRNQPAALKRLKPGSSKEAKKRAKEVAARAAEIETEMHSAASSRAMTPIEISDDEDEPIGDTHPVGYHVDKGDPRSPFPELNLCVTGNAHSDLLYSPQLKQQCRVVLKKESIEQFKDMLLDETTLWTRVRALMAKKEPEQLRGELMKETVTEPTFFTAEGQAIPVDLERNDGEKESSSKVANSRSGSSSPTDLSFLDKFFCT